MTLRLILLVLILLTGCSDKSELAVDSLSLQDVEEKLNGNWRINLIETKERKWIPHSSKYTIEYFELSGLKGINGHVIYNKDGSIATKTHQPQCELKEKNGSKVIEFIGLSDWTEMTIVKLSDSEMILSDSTNTVTYIREK